MVTGPDPDHREPRTFQGGNDLFTSESRQLAHGPTVTRWIPTKSSGSAACQLMRYAEQPQQSAPRPLAAASWDVDLSHRRIYLGIPNDVITAI